MRILSAVAAITLMLAVSTAFAVEPLTAKTLDRYCAEFDEKPESILSQKCVAYVGGFLDGAIVTDSRVAENVVKEIEEEEETFTQRAIRTRISDRMKKFGPSVYAEFCVGEPVPIKELVIHVVEEIDSRKFLEGVAARQIVYASLKEHYPCSS